MGLAKNFKMFCHKMVNTFPIKIGILIEQIAFVFVHKTKWLSHQEFRRYTCIVTEDLAVVIKFLDHTTVCWFPMWEIILLRRSVSNEQQVCRLQSFSSQSTLSNWSKLLLLVSNSRTIIAYRKDRFKFPVPHVNRYVWAGVKLISF